jgi:hypothetical protein
MLNGAVFVNRSGARSGALANPVEADRGLSEAGTGHQQVFLKIA